MEKNPSYNLKNGTRLDTIRNAIERKNALSQIHQDYIVIVAG